MNPHTHECDYFTNAVRAHLTTTSTKPCVYFATTPDGTQVFVKGPYPNEISVNKQLKVAEFKRAVDPELPSIDMEVVYMNTTPGFLECQFGLRTKCEGLGYFLVCKDVIQPLVDGPLPTKLRSSPKAWPTAVTVVDMEALFHLARHGWYDKSYENSIYLKEPEMAVQYVMHILLSWACGCGADLANSNFLLINGRCYHVNLAAWGCFNWNISDSTPGSLRTYANRFLCRFVSERWDCFQVHLDRVNENWSMVGDGFDNHEIIGPRLKGLSTLDGVLSAIQLKREKGVKRVHV